MKQNIIENGDLCTIHCQGSATSEDTAQMQSLFLETLSKYSKISLDLNEVENIDLSALQLIYAFYKTAIRERKSLSIHLKKGSDAAEAFAVSGLFKSKEG